MLLCTFADGRRMQSQQFGSLQYLDIMKMFGKNYLLLVMQSNGLNTSADLTSKW